MWGKDPAAEVDELRKEVAPQPEHVVCGKRAQITSGEQAAVLGDVSQPVATREMSTA